MVYFRGLAQSGGVLGHRPNLALSQAGSHAAHGRVGVVGARPFLETLQLGSEVLGKLAGKPRVLRY